MSKRIYISLKRKKNNLLLFFLLLGLISLLVIGFLIEQVARWNITEIEKTYGNSFRLSLIRDETDGDLWEQRSVQVGKGEGAYELTTRVYVGPNVNYDMMERISKVEGIREYEAGRAWYVLLLDYHLIPGYQDHSYKWLLEHYEKYKSVLASPEDTKNKIYVTEAYPVRNSTYFEKFYDGSFALLEGRHIQSEDDHVAIISDELASRNELEIGDILRIDGYSTVITPSYPIESVGSTEVEIIGLFRTTYQQMVSEYTNEQDILENWVIVDTQTGLDLNEMYGAKDDLYGGYFFLENPSELDEVMERVQALDWIDWSYYELEKNDTIYANAVAPLRTIRAIMIAVLGIVVVSGIALLILVMTYTVEKRTREIGILMALGISGKEIRYQIILEHLLIGLAAYIIALGIGNAAAPAVGNQLLASLNAGSEQKFYTEEEIEAAIARGDYRDNLLALSENAKNQRVGIAAPETLEIDLNFWSALLVGIVEVAIILFCVNHSIKKTLKLEPIRVLSMIR